MSTFRGTARLIYFDIYAIAKIMWLVTLLIAVGWVILGLAFDLSGFETTIAGPLYVGLFVVYPILAVSTSFRYATGFGSTRVQFLKVFYLSGVVMVIANVVLFNLLYRVLDALTANGILGFGFMHTADMTSYDSLLAYVWIDLMAGLFLFGISFLIASIWFRFGFIRFLVGSTAIGFIFYFLHVTGGLKTFYEWTLTLSGLTGFTLLGGIGSILLLATFPVMRHAPLKENT
ncbi:hypothetical protein [Pseudalkalibacillus sp. SCS-8]|uniref:hypothetical protein n=1 Tax=Pseudalkalibacillus nanhaiensis TaxID=3115291 RepID=UPI0032D9E753